MNTYDQINNIYCRMCAGFKYGDILKGKVKICTCASTSSVPYIATLNKVLEREFSFHVVGLGPVLEMEEKQGVEKKLK